jgi:hypothetical protein
MRVATVIGVLLLGGAATVRAQHAHQLEFGGYGTYTRYDRAFLLNNQFGGGGRLGYFFNDYIGLEVDANISYPTLKNPLPGGITSTQVRLGSASIVINGGGDKNVLYVLGGYSRLDMGMQQQYQFGIHAAHGAIGDRIFIGNHMALRLEARAYYSPNNCCLNGGSWVGHVVGSAGLSLFLGSGGGPKEQEVPEIPRARRDSILAAGGKLPTVVRPRGGPSFEERASDWQHKWYWGAEAGIFIFKTNYDNYAFEPTFGGHWLITGKKTALYVGYEESFFITPRHVTMVEPGGAVSPGNVSFNNLRRIMVGVLAFPAQTRIEPFAGGGFAIMEALSVNAGCPDCTSVAQLAQLADQANAAATKAFFWWMGGIDIKQGRLALYGHYVITSAAAGFLIQGTTHTFQGGIRYSLGTSKEGITDH